MDRFLLGSLGEVPTEAKPQSVLKAAAAWISSGKADALEAKCACFIEALQRSHGEVVRQRFARSSVAFLHALLKLSGPTCACLAN